MKAVSSSITFSLLTLYQVLGVESVATKPLPANNNCPCGYYIPETKLTLTSRNTLSASNLKSGTTSSKLSSLMKKYGFQVDVIELSTKPQQVNYVAENVYYNADLNSLDLKITGNDDPTAQDSVDSAEVSSIDSTMRYGSFRYTVQMDSVPGACHGMFFYKNDTDEVDIEVTTRWMYGPNTADDDVHQHGLQYTIQGPKGNFKDHPFTKFDPTQAFHQYRFDWSDGRVDYFTDGQKYDRFRSWTPGNYDNGSPWGRGVGAQMVINNWSDGDKNWTGDAPAEDNVLHVRTLDVFFNSTSVTANRRFSRTCAAARDKRLCLVN